MGLWTPSEAEIYSGVAPVFTYTDNDISLIVGSQRVLCLISIEQIGGAFGGKISARPKGETYTTWGSYAGVHGPLYAALGGPGRTTSLLVTTNDIGVFQWYCTSSFTVKIRLEGYFVPSEAPAILESSYAVPAAWAEHDISLVIGANEALVLMRLRYLDNSGIYDYAARPRGNTRNMMPGNTGRSAGVQAGVYSHVDGYVDTLCAFTDGDGVYERNSLVGAGNEELYMYAGEIEQWRWRDNLIYSGDPTRDEWFEVDTGAGRAGLAFLEVHYGALGSTSGWRILCARKKGDTSKDWSHIQEYNVGDAHFLYGQTPGVTTGVLVVPMDENGKIELYPYSRYLVTLDWQVRLLGYVAGGALGKKVLFHNNWGAFATTSDLPNVSGASVQDAALETGDRAYVTSTSMTYQCTLATVGAATWAHLTSDSTTIHTDIAGEIGAIAAKAYPTASDLLLTEDVSEANGKRSITVGDLTVGAATDPSAIHDNVGGEISAVTSKAAPVPNDLLLLEDSADSNAKKRATLGSTRRGSKSNFWYPPAVAHTDDDEFDDDAIDVVWEVYNDSASAVGSLDEDAIAAYDGTFTSGNIVRANQNSDTRRSWLLLQPPASDQSLLVSKPFTPATNMLMLARMRFSQLYAAEGHSFSLGFWQAISGHVERDNGIEAFLSKTATNIVQAAFRRKVGGVIYDTTYTTDVDAQGQALEYVAIHKIGTTYHGWVGTAAGNWIYMGNHTFTGTIAYAGFGMFNVSTSSMSRIYGADFIRFFETDNFLI